MDLTNASAIVTGGAGGFGSATVRRLARKGAKVVIAVVADERGEALAREVATSQAAEEVAKNEPLPSNQRGVMPAGVWG